MEYRLFGHSGLKVPVLSFGTATFGGGSHEFFKTWGNTEEKEATRMIDLCLEQGVSFFDTADIYSNGNSETILGKALAGKRNRAMISTKGTFSMGEGPNDKGSSRYHIIRACEASLKRLGTDYIDIYFMHAFDALTPIEETLSALDHLIKQGKIRYIGCSNFSGWHLMKSIAISERYGLARYAVYQGYYSLVGRDYEWELMPLASDQKMGLMVWSPLGWGRLTGKIRRGQPLPKGRIQSGGSEGGPHVDDERLFMVVDALEAVAQQTGKSIPQIALNWLLQRPTVVNLVIGARNEAQLKENLGAIGWNLTKEQVAKLDAASQCPIPYPYWHQDTFKERIPSLIG